MLLKFLFQRLIAILLILTSNNLFATEDIIFVMEMSKDQIDYYKSRGAKENRDVAAVFSFLKEEFSSKVATTQEAIKSVLSSAKTIRNVVYVGWEIGTFKRDLGAVGRYPMKISFLFSDESIFTYDCSVNINGYTYDLKMAILRSLKKNVIKEEILNKVSTIDINKDVEVISKVELDTLSKSVNNDAKSIFGVYKLMSSSNFTSLGKIGVFNRNNEITLVNIESSAFMDDWKEGQIIGKLETTASSKYFTGKYKGIVGNYNEITIMYDDSILELVFTKNNNSRKFIKLK